jgi:hypothetical protein
MIEQVVVIQMIQIKNKKKRVAGASGKKIIQMIMQIKIQIQKLLHKLI